MACPMCRTYGVESGTNTKGHPVYLCRQCGIDYAIPGRKPYRETKALRRERYLRKLDFALSLR